MAKKRATSKAKPAKKAAKPAKRAAKAAKPAKRAAKAAKPAKAAKAAKPAKAAKAAKPVKKASKPAKPAKKAAKPTKKAPAKPARTNAAAAGKAAPKERVTSNAAKKRLPAASGLAPMTTSVTDAPAPDAAPTTPLPADSVASAFVVTTAAPAGAPEYATSDATTDAPELAPEDATSDATTDAPAGAPEDATSDATTDASISPASTETIISASKAAGNAGATTNTGPDWKRALRDELARLPDDFAAYCVERGASVDGAWDVADSDALRGLEAWGRELADRDRRLGVAALVAAAQVGFPRAMKAAGDKAANMGFHASEGSMDGAPVETQIERGAAWLADPSDDRFDEVVASLDPTRQLNVWDEDLLPQSDEDAWFWYSEVGQCIAHAISGQGGEIEGATYYEWTPPQSVGRGLVMAVRGLRKDADDAAVIEAIRAGMVA